LTLVNSNQVPVVDQPLREAIIGGGSAPLALAMFLSSTVVGAISKEAEQYFFEDDPTCQSKAQFCGAPFLARKLCTALPS
jgi:hypothetical protein